MQAFDTVTIDELVALPPTIFGSSVGRNTSAGLRVICAVVSTFAWKSILQPSSALSAVESTRRFPAPASGKMWLMLFLAGS
jgi:hypothetical protein